MGKLFLLCFLAFGLISHEYILTVFGELTDSTNDIFASEDPGYEFVNNVDGDSTLEEASAFDDSGYPPANSFDIISFVYSEDAFQFQETDPEVINNSESMYDSDSEFFGDPNPNNEYICMPCEEYGDVNDVLDSRQFSEDANEECEVCLPPQDF